MKVIYQIENFSIKGGAERIIAEKANYMVTKWGWDVTIISIYSDLRPQSYPLDKRVKLVSLDISYPQSQGLRGLFTKLSTLYKIRNRLHSEINARKPDVVFFTMVIGGLLLPFINTSALKIYESHSARRFTPFHQFFRPMERAADAVVCLTKGDADCYRYAQKVVVIPNFINSPEPVINSFSTHRAIAAGRLERVKGFDILIDCWKEISARHPDWTLDIYGEGSEHDALQKQINALSLSDKITLKGNVSDMTQKYGNYSLFLMTSHYEGLPMVLLESQAAGLPAVTFDFEYGAADIISDGVNGLLVPQDDRSAFIAAMDRMMSSEQLRAHCGKHARETLKRFSRDTIMEAWKQLVNSLRPGMHKDCG